ncbi:MAG: DUF5665 domain-containing protein [Patescibacteria group bacterium]
MKLQRTDQALSDFARALDRYYSSWGTLISRSFVSGLFTALGATVGLALVLGLGGLILEQLGVLPVVGGFFGRINDVLNHTLSINK